LTPFFFGRPPGQFLLVFGQRDGVARLGAGFDLGPRFLQRGFALLAASDLFGKAQPVLQRCAVSLRGFGQQFFDFPELACSMRRELKIPLA
jgi:hypothetical protein